MYYLFFQIWVWIILAFALGWLACWFFCCRNRHDEENSINLESTSIMSIDSSLVTTGGVTGSLASNASDNESVAIDESWKPDGFTSAPEQIDDLKRIKGVGAVIEETLNDLGIYQFAQIEAWSDDNISWIENFLAFPGRISREDWVKQSKTLGAGGTTEFAKRVDKGDVDYS